jgi:hypothetical protein
MTQTFIPCKLPRGIGSKASLQYVRRVQLARENRRDKESREKALKDKAKASVTLPKLRFMEER